MKLDVIYRDDCINGMRLMLDESVDLIVTDPPYLMKYKTGRRKDKKHKFCNEINGDDDPQLIHNYILECYRILKNNSACYMFCNSNKIDFFKIELENAGFNVKNIIVWIKNNHTAGDLIAQFGKRYELLFYVNKGRCPINGKRIDDIWEFDKIPHGKQIHQNQKPLALIKRCIEKSSNENDIVFDGFMGSGTTAIACLETNRHYVGYELDEEYHRIAERRIIDYYLQEL